MLKVYMNEPFATDHELAQARRLVDILSRNHSGGASAWLCFNFSLGGKALDAAYITSDKFVIIELKAVGGDVNCGVSIENAPWTWSDTEYGENHVISTAPYANPFSQVKNYRTAVIGELEQRQRGFLKNTTLLKDDTNFAWWVKGCVLLSKRNAEDVRIVSNELSRNSQNWFCYGTLGEVYNVTQTLNCGVKIAPKEVEKLVREVIGLRLVDRVLENAFSQTEVAPKIQSPATTTPPVSFSAIRKFKKRYGDNLAGVPKKDAVKTNGKDKTKSNVVNDFADIDRLLSASDAQNAEPQDCSGQIVASERPFKCGYLKLTLSGEMETVANGCGSVVELEGKEAVSAVEKSCPDIGRFEVSKVLRFEGIPSERKDDVLKRFAEKYPSPQWKRIAYYGGGINFVFGRVLENGTESGTKPNPILCERTMNPAFILPRWLRNHIDKVSEGLPPLSTQEVQQTVNLASNDVQRYARTYLPRSCAEAFVTLDWVLGEEQVNSDVSLLDVGCGSAGATLGCLLAIHKHGEGNCSVRIDGIDANENSLLFAKQIIDVAQKEMRGGTICFNRLNADISEGIATDRKYDIVIASKSIGELALRNGPNAYEAAVRRCADKMTQKGVLLVVDIPKHEGLLLKVVGRLNESGYTGWCKRMNIVIGDDNEEFVCGCLVHGTTTESNSKKE